MSGRVINEATWFRSAVKIQRGRIIPVSHYERYNPFDFYYPYERGKRMEKSIHFEFAKLNVEKDGEIIAFCQRFGIIGNLAPGWANQAINSLQVAENEFEQAIKKLPKTLSGAANMLAELTQILVGPPSHGLYGPMNLSDFKSAHSTFKFAMQLAQNSHVTHSSLSESYRISLANLITFRLRFLLPQITWQEPEQSWGAFWKTPSLDVLFWLMLALDVIGPGFILSCPHCGAPFLAVRPNTRFCSPRCQNVFKVLKHYKKHPRRKFQEHKPDAVKPSNNS